MTTNEADSTLDPDEPHTPLWFTILGLGLFMVAGIFLVASSGNEEEEATASSPTEFLEAPSPEPPPKGENAPAAPPSEDPHKGHGHD